MDLVMFAHGHYPAIAESLGVQSVLVDLEKQGKAARQYDFDTEISTSTIADVSRVRALTDVPLICRIDGHRAPSDALVKRLVDDGVDEILLSMVAGPGHVERVLALSGHEVGVSVMIETTAAVAAAAEIAALPLRRAFVGLNDLWIERGTRTRFDALVDGTVEHISYSFADIDFGVGGATHPTMGSPLPAELLLSEIERVGADFTFLRRSFFRACRSIDPAEVVAAINQTTKRLHERTEGERRADHAIAAKTIASLPPGQLTSGRRP